MKGIGIHVCSGCGAVFTTLGEYLNHVEECP